MGCGSGWRLAGWPGMLRSRVKVEGGASGFPTGGKAGGDGLALVSEVSQLDPW